jgi:spermidine/putrescine transport system substrate-binding protein
MRDLDRRDFIRLAAAGLLLPGMAEVLAACTRAGGSGAAAGPGASLPRPEDPVTWPFFEDNAAIQSELPIERGATLKVYEWRDYLAPLVIQSFEHRYRAHDVHVEVSSFENRDAAAARIAQPGSDLDVFFPTVDRLGDLVGAKLLLPLNHDYLPNLEGLWPTFSAPTAPFYDVGQRYTVPYTVFSTGIGYRRDLVRPKDAPGELEDPCSIFGNDRYRGKIGVLDSYREPLAMALQEHGDADVNTGNGTELSHAADELIGFARATHLRSTEDGDYEGLARGEFAVHQAWSGDVLAARRFGETQGALTDQRLGYWWMRDGGVVGCDLLAVLSTGRNPVLGHLFLNHLLDLDVAMRNFAWNGYQPPLVDATRGAFASAHWGRAVPPHLLDDTILTPEEFGAGSMLLRLDPVADARWIEQWRRFTDAL